MISTTQSTPFPMMVTTQSSINIFNTTSKRVSFAEIANLLQTGQIERYFVDESTQYLTQKPNTKITSKDKNGNTYYATIRYDKNNKSNISTHLKIA